jgi:hypothetical protein
MATVDDRETIVVYLAASRNIITCYQLVQRYIGPLCYHNLTRDHEDIVGL